MKTYNRLTARAIVSATLALLTVAAVPAVASAAPVGCAGPDAPPACGGQPPAPRLLLSTPRFTPDRGADYFRVSMALTPSTVAAYAGGSTLPFRAYIDCSNGFGSYFSLILSADRRTASSDLKGWSLVEGESCTINTDAWVVLHLSHATVERQSMSSSPLASWVANFS